MTQHPSSSSLLQSLASRALALTLLCVPAMAQTVASYDASLGEFPEAPCWTLGDSADPEDPMLVAGKLVISSSVDSQNQLYGWYGPMVFGPKLVIEVRMRLVSGSSSASARAPAVVGFTTSPFTGNGLFIEKDEIFLLLSNSVKGDSEVLDTDDQAHTYRIEVSGTAAGSLVEVYYDDEPNPRLQGTAINDSNVNSSTPRLFFGEGSVFAQGISEWETVSHNAAPVYCCGQANSCGNNEVPSSIGVAPGGTYDANGGNSWELALGGVPAAPSPGLLIYGFAPSNPAIPVETGFGTLCLGSFFRASSTVTVPDATAGGCAAPSQYSFDTWGTFVDLNKAAGINGFSAGGTDEVWVQAWHRDPTNPGTANLSQVAGPFFVMP